MSKTRSVALGLDFGTESVRALLVGLDGTKYGSVVANYRHGQITEALPTDGSVRFISENVDSDLFHDMGSRAGGEVINLP